MTFVLLRKTQLLPPCRVSKTAGLAIFAVLFVAISKPVLASSIDNSIWHEARSRIQHLSSMQNAAAIKSPLNAKKGTTPQSLTTLDCVLRRGLNAAERKQCFGYLAEASKQKLEPRETSRLLLAIEALRTAQGPFSWQDSIVLAGAAANLGDAHLAKNILQVARENVQKTEAEWVLRRLDLYMFLVDLKAEAEPERRREMYERGSKDYRDEALFQEIRQRLEDILSADGKHLASQSKASPEAVLKELTYLRWQLAQDRDELMIVAQAIERDKPDLFDFHRLDQLVRRYDSSNKQWKAIINLVTGMSTGAELLMRSGALQVMMEHWLATAVPQSLRLEADQDRNIARSRMILQEFSPILATVLAAVRADKKYAAASENLAVLEERMNLLPSPIATAFNDSLFERDLQAVRIIQGRLVDIEKRIRRAHALLAGYYFFSTLDASESRNISNIRTELRELEAQKRLLLLEFFKVVVVLQPNVQKDFRALIRLNAQHKKSLKDLRSLLGDPAEFGTASGPAAVRFLDEADALVAKIESDSYRIMALRREAGERIVKALEPLQQDVLKINSEMSNILSASSSELRPTLRRLLKNIDLVVGAKARDIELKMSLAQATIRDDAASRLDSARATKERLEMLRRMRGENLEWRVAQ